jgi:hypothetical protein
LRCKNAAAPGEVQRPVSDTCECGRQIYGAAIEIEAIALGKDPQDDGARSRGVVSSSKDDETNLRGGSHFPNPRKTPETAACYEGLRSTNEGLVMWDIIIGLFYHRSCRKHLTDMRKHRWNLAPG